jgi:uncharacterized iron-regulated membrane protein
MFLRYLALILEWIFFIGLAGSLIVAILAFVGDLHVFFENDEDAMHAPGEHSYSPSPAGDD